MQHAIKKIADEPVGNIQPLSSSTYPYLVVGVLALVYLSAFLDRQIVSILAQPIKTDLGLSDTQVGLLSGFMFAVFYATFGIPLAWLADRWRKVPLIVVSCALWSGFTMACGLAGNFAQLALARMGVGLGEAGSTPLSISVIATYFRPERRGFAISLFLLGAPAGMLIGAVAGAAIADQWGWRAAFLIVGAPGIVLALLVLVLIREPRNAEMPKGEPPPNGTLFGSVAAFFRSRPLRTMAVANAFAAFISYAIVAWVPAFLMRSHGMTLAELGPYYGLGSTVVFVAGLLAGGAIVDRFGRTDQRVYVIAPAVGLLIGLPFYIAATLVTGWQLVLGLALIPLGTSVLFTTASQALVQNLAPAECRTMFAAILLFLLNTIGLGGGPLFVGIVSDLAARAGASDPLRVGMLALAPVFVLTILLYWISARAIAAAEPAGAVA